MGGGKCANWASDWGYDITNANNCRAGLQYSEAMQKELALQKNTVAKGEHPVEDAEAVYNALVKAQNDTDNPDWLLDIPESRGAFDAPPTSGHVTKWELDVRASMQRNGVTRHISCCVCRGGWIAGYDPQGDMATETDTVPGTCYAETNAHYSPAGWTSGSPRQACL